LSGFFSPSGGDEGELSAPVLDLRGIDEGVVPLVLSVTADGVSFKESSGTDEAAIGDDVAAPW
jgi:hypothetical protein